MNRYRLVHTIRYDLDGPVAVEALRAQLRPRDLAHQRVGLHQLIVRPGALLSAASDSFGNPVTHLKFSGHTAAVEIHGISELALAPGPRAADAAVSWERVRERLQCDEPNAVPFSRATGEMADAAVEAAARDYAGAIFTSGRPLDEAVRALAHRMLADFHTDPEAVHAAPGLGRVFETRSGICEDRARAAVACLRACGLAARYVGGYVFDGTRTQTHAWFAARWPDGLWFDFDPSLADDPTYARITVGWGLDAGDVVPVRGRFAGGGRQSMTSSVRMQPIRAGEVPGADHTRRTSGVVATR